MPPPTVPRVPPGAPLLHPLLHPTRAFLQTAVLAATGSAAEGWLFLLLDYALRGLRVALLLAVWREVLAGPAGAADRLPAGLTPESILQYTLVAGVFGDQLAARSRLEEGMWSGSVVTRFLQPTGLMGQVVAEMVGGWLPGLLLFSLPLLLLAPLLGVDPRPAGPLAAVLFPLSLGLGVAVGVALDVILTALMVTFGWTVWEVERWRGAIGTVFSGALLPLAVLPWNLGDVLAWLPTAAMAWAPLSLYTGTGEPLPLLASQAGWAVVMWAGALALWRRSRQKVVVYGG